MIFSDSNNMMAFKFSTASTALVVVVSAVLALVSITLKNGTSEGLENGSIIYAALASLPVAMFISVLYAIGISILSYALVPRNLAFLGRKPSLTVFGVTTLHLSDMIPIAVSLMADLKAHTCKCRANILCKSFVPNRHIASLVLTATRMMTTLVKSVSVKGMKTFATPALTCLCFIVLVPWTAHATYLRKDIELFAVHYTGKLEGSLGKERELLEHPESHTHHNVAGNSKREGMKSGMDWAISSQAAWKQVEGSTTRVWSLTRANGMAVKPHEHAPLKGMM